VSGNYPAGVTDNDPHFADDECRHRVVKHGYCDDCGELVDEDAAAEWQADREAEDGEAFRGGEAAAFHAEQQERARRLK
jgi:Fe2+ or Zn2+ uptake regulation protein